MKKIYFDNAATTPLDPRVLTAMIPFLKEKYGNASSIHSLGQEARSAIEEARQITANFIGAKSDEVTFTSGGTESNNMVIKGVATKYPSGRIITTNIEHEAVLRSCQFLEKNGYKIAYLKVNNNGLINSSELEQLINDETVLISVMHANNEIGVIEPIKEIGQIVKKIREERKIKGVQMPIYFHTDAVQTFGHLPININKLNLDFLSASAHKLYGPKGVGLLYHRRGIKLESLIHGGGHEGGWRSGTENVAGIIGFAKAVDLARNEMVKENKRLMRWQKKIIKFLEKIKGVSLNGDRFLRLANNINISIDGLEGEAVVLYLDERGVACSTGSACSSRSLSPSHVLLALGKTPVQAHSSLRLTLGRFTTERDINYLLKVLPLIIKKLRHMSPTWQKK